MRANVERFAAKQFKDHDLELDHVSVFETGRDGATVHMKVRARVYLPSAPDANELEEAHAAVTDSIWRSVWGEGLILASTPPTSVATEG